MKTNLKLSSGFAASGFLVCLAAAAYAHMRYTQAERLYTQHLGTVTFTPHSNAVGKLDPYAAHANHWLTLQSICTGFVLLASIAVIVQIVQARNARMVATEPE